MQDFLKETFKEHKKASKRNLKWKKEISKLTSQNISQKEKLENLQKEM